MFGDVWSEDGKRTRTQVLVDFDQKKNKRDFNKLRADRQDNPGQAEALIRIERFVDYVLRHNGPAYKPKIRGSAEFSETRIGKRLRKIFPLHSLFDSLHVYSEKPAAFLRACWQAERQYVYKVKRPVRSRFDVDIHYAEIMNMIVETIRHSATELWFKRCGTDRRYQARANGKVAAMYVMDILNYLARTEIVRMDFGYKGGESAPVTIDRAWSDFSDFIDLLDYHPLFTHLVGYMWSLEQGDDGKGFHMHAAFFFNGSEICRDIVIADRIGDLWEDRITQGRGNFFNCNKHTDRYSYVGIGTIHRNNSEQCLNAIRCLQYLPKAGEFLHKDSQYLRIKTKALMRTFGTGQAPEIMDKHRGRPAEPAPWLDQVHNVLGSSVASLGVASDVGPPQMLANTAIT
jgi:hypothetical protein